MSSPIIIIGGGIGGLTTALSLLAHDQPCEVHERAPALQEIGAGLALWPAALRVFDQLGIGEEVRALGGRLFPSGIRTADGRWLLEFRAEDLKTTFGEAPIGVHRGELQALLLRHLPAELVHTGHAFVSAEEHDSVDVRFSDGTTVEAKGVVGADGCRSAVRSSLIGDRPLRDRRYVAWRGTTSWPVGVDHREVAGEFWGRTLRFGFLPIGGNRLTWYGSARAFLDGGGLDEAIERFATFPDPIPRVVASTPADMLWADRIQDRLPLRRWTHGRMTLLGDAAHPMTPELGQGACQAVIDAWTLAEEVSAWPDVAQAFDRYERRRRRRTAMVQLAARAMAAGGNVERPFAQRVRSTLTSALPRRVALAEFRLIAG